MKGIWWRILVSAFVLCGGAATASALTIDDFDLSLFDFDVLTYQYSSSGLDGRAIATGTSNGINWSITPTNIYSGLTNIDGDFRFDSLPVLTDNLHVSRDFTITFDRLIDTLLVALDNDSGTDSLNLGLIPVDYRGLTVQGTQLSLARGTIGGLALFENIGSLTITHTNINERDGFDLAFHATEVQAEPVPEPATVLLFCSGMAGLLGTRWRKGRLGHHAQKD